MKTLVCFALALLASLTVASAATYTLDAAASPISVLFNDAGGKFTVTHKASGWVWRNPDTLVSSTNPSAVSSVVVNGLTLTANVTISGNTYALTAELRTSPSELRVTLGGAATTNLSSVNYPHPFYASDGQGFAVLPFDSGYVVPNTETTFTLPGGMRGMEWYGGTDASNQRAWMAIVDSSDDYELKVRNGTISGVNYLAPVMNWRGSNSNASHTANKLSYDRTLRFRFLDSGGYVAMAKVFRAEAQTRGWLKTLSQKQAESGAPNVDAFVGSPVIYMWGDGRSTTALDALKNAGVTKAHIQVSVNHVDQQKNFPATGLADNAWFDAVRARGYTGGFYDIYAATRTGGTGGSAYDGFYYLWPSNAYNDWAILSSTGTFDTQHTISAQMAAAFAGGTRMPAHISRFNLDACFFDVVCAVDLAEDYDATFGHFATRGMDRTNRSNLLNTAYGNSTKKLLSGTEQGRSWAVPYVHWTEGKFWIGNGSSGISDGSFNDNSYPQIMVDVVEPTTTQLAALMSDGYQVPLWDLVFHDCMVSTVHWHRCHNKYLYLWDHADRWALLRGQAPLMNLTYDGVQGLAGRAPNSITDGTGKTWTSRLTSNLSRVVQTFNTVCTWHNQIGKMEMIAHSRLTADRSVQMSEFSNDNGATGKGIVVNFGVHDGATGITGSTWTGSLRGQSLTVPIGSYQTYTWGGSANTAPSISTIAVQSTTTGTALGPIAFTVGDAETAATALSVTATSSNTTLLPNANITLGGSGASRTITLAPAAAQNGSSTITVSVSDGSLTTSTTFTLTVTPPNSAPTISTIANQTIAPNAVSGPLGFTIGDAETAATSLTVSGTSSNTTLLPNANIVFGGSGASRTVTLTPAASQFGSTTVTLTVSDGSLAATASFTLIVDTAPTVSTIASQTTTTDVPVGPISFTIGDAESAATSLTVFRNSSNTTLVPVANIVLGGSGANRTVTVTPGTGQTGTGNIILIVGDGLLTTVRIFTLTVNAGGNTAPTITSISNQSTTPGTAVGPLSFTIGDAQTAAASLIVTGSSSNTTLLPNANVVFGGTGASRTVTLTPATGQSGSSTVTLTVSDGSLTAQTSFSLVVSSGPQTVTALTALHQNGQTYLTWSEVADSTATYRIYRSATPFTSTAQLVNANFVGTASADSSFDARLSDLRATSYFYRITAAGPDLTAAQGLYVHTPISDGSGYYAVTAVVSGIEQVALSASQNTTNAVNEVVAMPLPVFQRNLTISSRTVEVYAHWTSAIGTSFYPAMGNESSVAHHLGLVRRGTASTHSLVIRPHARQGSFLSTVTGTTDADEWVLTLDDWMPNTIENTFWYGYHEAFDIDTGLPQATTGTIHDYTTRRAKWEIEWALRTLPLDLNRIYMTGHSMGGIGSTFLGILMRDKIAAIWTTSAKYDFSFLNDPNPANIWNSGSNERATSGDIMWGTVPTALMSSEGIPVYDRLNASKLVQMFKADAMPVMIAFHGKNDVVVGWAEKLGFYTAMNANKHGGQFFFDSGVHNRTGGEFVSEQDINVLNRYRLNQSYPAFSNSSANGTPGNGTATNGDTFGTLNGNLDWDTTTIIDTATQWQIKLMTTALNASTGTIAAPASATVDVTPRRLQAFPHTPGTLARYEVRDLSNTLLQSGLITADAAGLFTAPAISITNAGTTLTLQAVATTPPTMSSISTSISLLWPTTPGMRYQVEWSDNLAQWFSAGASAIASSSGMTWTDDGSQTGSVPGTQNHRFYRLRISE